MPRQHVAQRDPAPAHGDPPVDAAVGQLDLAEDDVDHPVDEVVAAGHVAVQRHRREVEGLGEPAHADGLEPAGVGGSDRGSQDRLPAQAAARLCSLDRLCGHTRTPSAVRLREAPELPGA